MKLDALKPWIHEKLTEILGFEDDVVIDYAINQLEETNTPDPKIVQINLTGFLNAKVYIHNDFMPHLLEEILKVFFLHISLKYSYLRCLRHVTVLCSRMHDSSWQNCGRC